MSRHTGRGPPLLPTARGYANLDPRSPAYTASPPARQPQPQYPHHQTPPQGYPGPSNAPPPPRPGYGHVTYGGGPPQPRYDAGTPRAGTSVDHRGTQGVATGAVGGAYGPYSYDPAPPSVVARPQRDSSLPAPHPPSRYSARTSSVPSPFAAPPPAPSHPPSSSGHGPSAGTAGGAASAPTPARAGPRGGPVWTAKDAAMDDKLHNPSPHDSLRDRSSCTPWSLRGWLNMSALFLLVTGLVTLFAGYPIIQFYTKKTMSTYGAFNVGGINATGQVPDIPGLPTLIDSKTPKSALTRTGFDGKKYVLAFSDEFETDGRTFWPGDDPFWEATDIHYWQTGDYEWYDPDAVTTKDGNLVITISEQPIHDLNFRSGMIQSWNKFCFTGGYVEVSIQLPGSSTVSGFWPGAWTMGNLGRAGYGASTDGMWPYSYNTCDLGTLPNQTNVAGNGPAAAFNSGIRDYGGKLSSLPGQRASACTCDGGEHPGPNVGVGRGAPEIDILEAQVSYKDGALYGTVSQSAQVAPFDAGYQPKNSTPYTVVFDATETYLNDYKGGPYQQACSAVSATDATAYEIGGGGFSTYGFEAYPDPTNGYITWAVGGNPTWTLTSAAVGPNTETQIGQRLVSQEPMYIILNLGMSASFQTINWADLKLPGHMLVDYVRVYQLEDEPNLGCDPPGMPTSDYINDHLEAYMNPNVTTWKAAGFEFPKNSMQGC